MDPQELYRDIVETSADGIWVFDLSGRTLYANSALAAMFGVSQEEFCRLTVFDSLDATGCEQFREHLADIAEGRFNDGDVECKFVRSDGSHLWVLVGERPLRAPDGSLRGVVHRLSDYSDRRRVVDDLTRSQQQLAEAQHIARIGSWEWDVRRDLITASQGLLDIYGLSASTFPARYAQFLMVVHEEDRVRVDRAVHEALEGADEFVFEARLQGASGWVWTRGRGVVHRDDAGEVASMSGTHQDISESRLADLALQDQIAQNSLMRAVASAANEARTLDDVLVQARSLVLLHDDWERARAFVVSDDGERVQPHDPGPAEQSGADTSPEQQARELALAEECLRRDASVWDEQRLTIAFPVRHGTRVHAVLTITSAPPLYRHDMIQTMVEQVAVQIGRVVEREQTERALADARDAAMEASRQKSEFLATMSHEIRTPLNGVIGLNDLLLRTRLDPDQHRLAAGVKDASRSLLGLINDVLDFSKIEAGKLELERVDFEVRDVLDQVANVLGATAREKGLELVVACGRTVPEVLRGDPTRLAQVVTNLVSNAVKFTEAGEVVVTVGATDHASCTTLRVDVTDTGIGIDPADVEHLFDSFTQADASTTRVHGGTGLGLAISREIVRAHGGEIGVDSRRGEGSRFWFTVVLDHATGSRTSPYDDRARSCLTGRRALLVDANPRTRDVVAAQLERWGLRLDALGTADEAEAALRHAHEAGDPFEIALVDRILAAPRRSGLSLARTLRAQPTYQDLVLLLLSSTTDLDTTTVRDYGVADFLVKPVQARALRSSLVQQLAGDTPGAVPEPHAPDSAAQRRVLVVEDNPVNQIVALGLLHSMGYHADTAEDGLVALELLAAHDYDVVLMDVQMPRLDGYATTQRIRARERGRRVPVVAMTAAAIEGERERCLAAGMDDFLTKPIDPDALAETLVRVLDGGPPPTVEATAEPTGGTELDLSRLDMLRDMAPGNTSYLDRAIGHFVSNAPHALASIRAAVAAGDAAALQQAAHRLAGSASNIGVVPVGAAALGLERVADRGTTEGTEELLGSLDEAISRGTAALIAYRAAYGGAEAV